MSSLRQDVHAGALVAGHALQTPAASGAELSWRVTGCMQVQRLKEHVQKKHADEEAPEEEDAPVQEHRPAPQVTCCLYMFRLLPCARGARRPPSARVCMPQAKTMDVNARAGFYTEKSPKMLLHEWCIAQKRPTPRYRVTPADDAGGAIRCKVRQSCSQTAAAVQVLQDLADSGVCLIRLHGVLQLRQCPWSGDK